jgi:hypothetical protein
MTAAAFIHPRYARTAPDPRPLRWDTGPDARALAEYIRACLRRPAPARRSV